MLGLIVKDFLISKRYTRTMLLLLAFYSIFGFLQKDGGAYLLFMTPLFFVMMTITTFAYDNAAKWDAYALSMPVLRNDMVFSKYAATLIFSFAGTLLSVIFTTIIYLIKGEVLSQELIFGALGALGAALLLISILLPLIYKFGVEKARLMMIAVFVVPTILGMVIAQTGFKPDIDDNTVKIMIILSLFVVIALLGISYLASCRIFAKKEL